jgi:hypothetical protein
MNSLPKILIVAALICLVVAILIKMTTIGKILPGPMPLNWAKLADTVLLFSIAISLLVKK